FHGPLFDTTIAALAAHASTVEELAATPSLSPFGIDALRKAVQELLMGKDVIPVRASPEPPTVRGSRYHVPSAFNRAVLTQPLAKAQPIVLASPVAGTGVNISMLHAVLLRALTEARPDERAAWIQAFVAANPLRVWDHGRTSNEKEDLARVVTDQFEQFSA